MHSMILSRDHMFTYIKYTYKSACVGQPALCINEMGGISAFVNGRRLYGDNIDFNLNFPVLSFYDHSILAANL